LSIYGQSCGRGVGRQQLSADVKCQKRHNEIKPLLRGLDIPHCAARSAAFWLRGITARIKSYKMHGGTTDSHTVTLLRRTGSLVHQEIQHIL